MKRISKLALLIVIAAIALSLASCAVPTDLYPQIDIDSSVSQLRYGMTIDEVFKAAGKRATVHRQDNVVLIGYHDNKREWALQLEFRDDKLYSAQKVRKEGTPQLKLDIQLPGAPVHGGRANDYPAEGLNN